MKTIFQTLREQSVNTLLEARHTSPKKMDELLLKLTSNDEDVWMEALFSGIELVSFEKSDEELLHDYDINMFETVYFFLKHHAVLNMTKEEKIEATKREEQERAAFQQLSLREKIEYMDKLEDYTGKITDRGCAEPILKEYLEEPTFHKVRKFIHKLLNNEHYLEKVQIISDASFFKNVITINYDEVIAQQDIEQMLEEEDVISIQLMYEYKEELYDDMDYTY